MEGLAGWVVELVAQFWRWRWLRVVVRRVLPGCGAVEASGRCVLQEEGAAEAPGGVWETAGIWDAEHPWK